MDIAEATLREEWLVMLDDRFFFFFGYVRGRGRKEMGLVDFQVPYVVCVMSL